MSTPKVTAPAPPGSPEERVPSAFTHPTYQLHNETTAAYGAAEIRDAGDTRTHRADAKLVGSRIVGGTNEHTVMLDLDLPATVVESSTPGHHHLYIDYPISWDKYVAILKAFYDAGIIEKGFFDSAVKQKQSFLRMPGIMKPQNARKA